MRAIAVLDDDQRDLALSLRLLEGALNAMADQAEAERPAVEGYSSPEALIGALQAGRLYDVFFLDIVMDRLSGLDVARAIHALSDRPYSLVFTTNSADFALEAFNVSAVDYLLKPLDDEKIRRALGRCHIFRAAAPHTITLTWNKTNYRIVRDDITYIESYAHVCVFHADQRQYSAYMTMDNAMRLVSDRAFIRCHKSYIVNLRHIRTINGSELILTDGAVIPVSRSMRRQIQGLYDDYLINCVWERRRDD